MKPVFIIVDLQNDFLRSPMLQPAAGELIARTAALLQRCRESGIPIVHVWTTVQRHPDNRMPHWKRTGKWICVEGTSGHATPLLPGPSELVVHKTVFSAFADGKLAEILSSLGADTIWLAGVQLHSCIRATAIDAYQRGLTVWIVSDAIGSEDPLHGAVTRRYLESRAARFVPSGELFNPIVETKDDVTKATTNAHRAWLEWRNTSMNARVKFLSRLAARVQAEARALIAQMASEIRKPIGHATAEVNRAVALIRATAGRANEALQEKCSEHSVMRYRPRGVIAAVTPWNNPVAIPLGKIAPALLYGNAVVWKPSPAAAAVSDRIFEMIEPHGVVSLVHGDGATAERLMADERIDAVTLTGSVATGAVAQAICGQRHIPLQAELGGNNAAIICSDADLQTAASAVAEGAFGFAGQRCTANRRVIVERACLDEFLKHLKRAVNALHPETDVGPLISTAKCDQVRALVMRAGEALFHGKSCNTPDFFPPTVIQCDDPTREIVQEETFGPVMVLQTATDFDHALSLCNGVRQGLVAALFSRSLERQARFLEDAQAGILKINLTTADADAEAPFGGWKESGIGPPEHGRSNREVYTRTQAVYTKSPI